MHRAGDFGGDALKYPMFWVNFSDMYDGDIYKTRNLKNKSMVQQYPDPDALKRAQDSIQNRLDKFEEKLWVPTREEVIAARGAREALEAAAADTAQVENATEKTSNTRATRRSAKRSAKATKPAKEKKVKERKPKEIKSSTSSSAARSVRRRR